MVFWDAKNDRPIGKGKRINRTEGKTSIEDRIKQRIEEFMACSIDQDIVDLNYVRAVLEANSWADFASSLLEGLEKYGNLTDKQMAYVLGDKNPNGKNTFEALAKKNNPNFFEDYLNQESTNPWEEKHEEPKEHLQEGVEEDTEKVLSMPSKPEVEQGLSGETADKKEVSESSGGKVISDADPVPTKDYEFYKYPFESFNPVQSAVLPHVKEDKNMIIGSSTGSGKTIACELLIDEIFAG